MSLERNAATADLKESEGVMSESIAKSESRLLSLAAAYKGSSSAQARNMLRGKAERLISKLYSVPANRKAVWSEWCALAEPNPKAWLRL